MPNRLVKGAAPKWQDRLRQVTFRQKLRQSDFPVGTIDESGTGEP
jgi:hypothetical protein